MKIDRLIGILSILLQQEKVTAPYLADKFEVSRRTINRDIEDLCMAGIPLCTTQGQNGGISIMEGYSIDKTLFTTSEMQSILAGLRGLDSVAGTKKYQALMDKLSVEESSTLSSTNHILIDLASWHRAKLAPKIELLQTAIDRKKVVHFRYYAPKGTSMRKVEPYLLLFQWSSWYVWGFSLERKDFRLFKLNRIQDLTSTETPFKDREIPPFHFQSDKAYPKVLEVRILVDASLEWILVDEFGLEYCEKQTDGRFLLNYAFTDKETLFQFVLGMGNRVELLEPAALRVELHNRIEKMSKIY